MPVCGTFYGNKSDSRNYMYGNYVSNYVGTSVLGSECSYCIPGLRWFVGALLPSSPDHPLMGSLLTRSERQSNHTKPTNRHTHNRHTHTHRHFECSEPSRHLRAGKHLPQPPPRPTKLRRSHRLNLLTPPKPPPPLDRPPCTSKQLDDVVPFG